MNKISVVSTWLGILTCIVIVFATIAHAAKTDPVGHVTSGYAAFHGIAPPFNR
ncbi:hypothetical protein [Bradyrhizobium sp. NP1]|uniref:hypothetical protein n=1 Tax=Bradyrhizobium sp. NP1 TaxID=3049772 RepID=UPI0025A54BDA|nr:hypothetical protein [Bradyrhizobium sp. NP1]WJR77253.1 hypothetical protein QOU61_31730 [Bradyrhizobium sp. NP1]